jgi:hypothetical protein
LSSAAALETCVELTSTPHITDAGQHLPLRLIAVPHHRPAALRIPLRGVLSRNPINSASTNDPLRSLARQITQFISKSWIGK